nr:MAG TPA: hypothetical protein [Caudoviricetes sp.]
MLQCNSGEPSIERKEIAIWLNEKKSAQRLRLPQRSLPRSLVLRQDGCSRWRRMELSFRYGAGTSSLAMPFSDISISRPSRRSARQNKNWKRRGSSQRHSLSYPKLSWPRWKSRS